MCVKIAVNGRGTDKLPNGTSLSSSSIVHLVHHTSLSFSSIVRLINSQPRVHRIHSHRTSPPLLAVCRRCVHMFLDMDMACSWCIDYETHSLILSLTRSSFHSLSLTHSGSPTHSSSPSHARTLPPSPTHPPHAHSCHMHRYLKELRNSKP